MEKVEKKEEILKAAEVIQAEKVKQWNDKAIRNFSSLLRGILG